jgi:hypothetical protein
VAFCHVIIAKFGGVNMQMKQKKRVSAIITEYWEISHADVIITKMLEGFSMDGYKYTSSIEVVSMYVDQFPENDMSRSISEKYNIPIYDSIEEALLCGGNNFDLDGIIIIGEHGDYPVSELGRVLYPRRRFFEECLNVMLKYDRIVPVYSDKAFAIEKEDIEWIYKQIKKYDIPFFSTSVIPFARQYPGILAPPEGAPILKILAFEMYGPFFAVHPAVDYPSHRTLEHAFDYASYHTMEVVQSIAEKRAYGETGVECVRVLEGKEALDKLLGATWNKLYRKLGMFINLVNVDTFPSQVKNPFLFEVDYVDGLKAALFYSESDARETPVVYQMYEDSEPYCTNFIMQGRKPYIHFGKLVLLIEKFIHTSRPPFPVERSYLTAGITDAFFRALKSKKEVQTPHLKVKY